MDPTKGTEAQKRYHVILISSSWNPVRAASLLKMNGQLDLSKSELSKTPRILRKIPWTNYDIRPTEKQTSIRHVISAYLEFKDVKIRALQIACNSTIQTRCSNKILEAEFESTKRVKESGIRCLRSYLFSFLQVQSLVHQAFRWE